MTKQERMKEKAIELMQKLDIYQPYIQGFKDENKVCFFEGFGGFWVDQEPEIEKKMKEIEEKNNCLVYAITHENVNGDDCYSFLIITNEPNEWVDLVMDFEYGKIAFAYVWNKDCEYDSEFGDIAVKCFGGGIKRIG